MEGLVSTGPTPSSLLLDWYSTDQLILISARQHDAMLPRIDAIFRHVDCKVIFLKTSSGRNVDCKNILIYRKEFFSFWSQKYCIPRK